jgi:hypothetical protein
MFITSNGALNQFTFGMLTDKTPTKWPSIIASIFQNFVEQLSQMKVESSALEVVTKTICVVTG